MIEQLKPCPLCGEKNIVVQTYRICGELNKKHNFVVCKNCGLSIEKETREETIDAWNKRTEG